MGSKRGRSPEADPAARLMMDAECKPRKRLRISYPSPQFLTVYNHRQTLKQRCPPNPPPPPPSAAVGSSSRLCVIKSGESAVAWGMLFALQPCRLETGASNCIVGVKGSAWQLVMRRELCRQHVPPQLGSHIRGVEPAPRARAWWLAAGTTTT